MVILSLMIITFMVACVEAAIKHGPKVVPDKPEGFDPWGK